MCIKSSCTNCHSKSHCKEKSLRDEIEEYKKLTEKLIKELEDSNKCLELAGEKIEKMKCCENCKHVRYENYDYTQTCEYIWYQTNYQQCSRYSSETRGLSDLWELG